MRHKKFVVDCTHHPFYIDRRQWASATPTPEVRARGMKHRFRQLSATMLEQQAQDAFIDTVGNLDAADTVNLEAPCRLIRRR